MTALRGSQRVLRGSETQFSLLTIGESSATIETTVTVDQREYARLWREANPEKVKAARDRWREKHLERDREQGRRASRTYRATHKPAYVGGICGECGGKTSDPRAKRCAKCWAEFQHKNARVKTTADHRAYMRGYMTEWRQLDPQVKLERLRLKELKAQQRRESKPCRFRGCQFYGTEHRHCECGFEIRLTESFCHVCLAEQARVEFRSWAA